MDRPRTSGETKYGFFKILRGFSDLLLIWLWHRHAPRPGHLLFAGAIAVFVVGGGLLAAMLVSPGRGASTLGLAALISLALAVQLAALGLVAEVANRSYYQTRTPYTVRSDARHGRDVASSDRYSKVAFFHRGADR